MRDPRLVELDQLIKQDVPLLQKLVMKREAQKRARWQDATIRRETRRKLYLMETERLDNHDSKQVRAEASAAR